MACTAYVFPIQIPLFSGFWKFASCKACNFLTLRIIDFDLLFSLLLLVIFKPLFSSDVVGSNLKNFDLSALIFSKISSGMGIMKELDFFGKIARSDLPRYSHWQFGLSHFLGYQPSMIGLSRFLYVFPTGFCSSESLVQPCI